jgi:CRP-like cAMP-binding protein
MNEVCIIHDLPLEAEGREGRSGEDTFRGSELAFDPEQVIFREGSRIDGVYCLHAGQVALLRRYQSEDEIVLFIARAGDIIGFPGVINNDYHINTAITLDDVRACFIPRESFLRLIRENPGIALRAMQRLSRRIDKIELSLHEE